MISQLVTLTLAYIQFMSNLGDLSHLQMCINQLPELFAESVTKVENGRVIASGQPALLAQLENARNYALPWKIEVLDVICDDQNRASAVRFTWNSEKIGLFITTAILKFDRNNKIIEINEVYNKFSDITPLSTTSESSILYPKS